MRLDATFVVQQQKLVSDGTTIKKTFQDGDDLELHFRVAYHLNDTNLCTNSENISNES